MKNEPRPLTVEQLIERLQELPPYRPTEVYDIKQQLLRITFLGRDQL